MHANHTDFQIEKLNDKQTRKLAEQASQWLLNVVDFQKSGRNSNQVVGELPTSGWISKQWLEIHPL